MDGDFNTARGLYHSVTFGSFEWLQIDMGTSFDVYRVLLFGRWDGSFNRFYGWQTRVGMMETKGKLINIQ